MSCGFAGGIAVSVAVMAIPMSHESNLVSTNSEQTLTPEQTSVIVETETDAPTAYEPVTTTTTKVVPITTSTTVAPKATAAAAKSAASAPMAKPPVKATYTDEEFLTCVLYRESRGIYTVVNKSSGAAGAYQFMPQTWVATAKHARRFDLVLVPPQLASKADQDFMARHLLGWWGRSPWAGDGC